MQNTEKVEFEGKLYHTRPGVKEAIYDLLMPYKSSATSLVQAAPTAQKAAPVIKKKAVPKSNNGSK